MAGRRPKPIAVKKLAGNPGKRRLNHEEPQGGEANIRVPRGILDEEGQRLWRALAPALQGMGVLKDSDVTALEMLCMNWSLARKAWQQIQAEGLTVETMTGVKKHPAVGIFAEASGALRLYMGEFGLTPSARGRLKVEQPEEESLVEALFAMVNGG